MVVIVSQKMLKNKYLYFSGHIYDVTGNYDIPFILSGTFGLIAGVSVLILVLVMHIQRRKTINKGTVSMLSKI